MRYAFVTVVLSLIAGTDEKSHKWKNEIGVVNLCNANVRVRCQSILSDKKDVYLAPEHQLRFRFAELERGNRHFWCDVYGLFGFKETFDVYGRSAPIRNNITWFIKPDGLYLDVPWNQVKRWKWDFPPLETYAED
ncbi:hypothetical protein V3C99_013366 [Haemonchus contortus]|uniref:S-protein homolog n=1 Tax=Haemonchus contortus TaxID=6289 RepID=A0A7I4Y023_HAECO